MVSNVLELQCIEWLFKYRFSNVKECPKCQFPFRPYKIFHKRTLYMLCENHHTASPLTDTVFEHSKLLLPQLFEAIYLFDHGLPPHSRILARQYARQLSIQQETARHLRHRIELLYTTDRVMYDAILEWWTTKRAVGTYTPS